jgi:hypothetical protein
VGTPSYFWASRRCLPSSLTSAAVVVEVVVRPLPGAPAFVRVAALMRCPAGACARRALRQGAWTAQIGQRRVVVGGSACFFNHPLGCVAVQCPGG